MESRTDKWMEGCMDGRTDGQTDKWNRSKLYTPSYAGGIMKFLKVKYILTINL